MPHPAQNPHVRYVPVGSLPVTKRPRGFVRYLVLVAVALLIVWALTGCVQSELVRKLPDGSEERTKSYGLTDRAGRVVDAGVRAYFRLPQEPTPTK